MTLKMVLDYLIARGKEPSTYAGLAGIVAAVGLHLSTADVGAIVPVLTGLAGLAGVVLAEKGLA